MFVAMKKRATVDGFLCFQIFWITKIGALWKRGISGFDTHTKLYCRISPFHVIVHNKENNKDKNKKK